MWKIEGDCILKDDEPITFIRLKDVTSVINRVGYHTQLPEMVLTVLGGEKEFIFCARDEGAKLFNAAATNKIIELNIKKKVGRPRKK